MNEPAADTAIAPRSLVRDDVAYVLPMAIFMAFTWVGGQWPSLYPVAYVAKVILVTIALVVPWRHYTKISWRYWWLGAIVGVIGIFQWVPMQLWLQRNVEFFALMSNGRLTRGPGFESPHTGYRCEHARLVR